MNNYYLYQQPQLLNFRTGSGKTLMYLTLLHSTTYTPYLIIPHFLLEQVILEDIKYFKECNLQIYYSKLKTPQNLLQKYQKNITFKSNVQTAQIRIIVQHDKDISHVKQYVKELISDQYNLVCFDDVDDYIFDYLNNQSLAIKAKLIYVSANNDKIPDFLKDQIYKEQPQIQNISIETQSIKMNLTYHKVLVKKFQNLEDLYNDVDQFDKKHVCAQFKLQNKRIKQYIANTLYSLFNYNILDDIDDQYKKNILHPTKSEIVCPICLDDEMQDDSPEHKDKFILLQPCFHVICINCMKEMLKVDQKLTLTCPICREKVSQVVQFNKNETRIVDRQDAYTYLNIQDSMKRDIKKYFNISFDDMIYSSVTNYLKRQLNQRIKLPCAIILQNIHDFDELRLNDNNIYKEYQIIRQLQGRTTYKFDRSMVMDMRTFEQLIGLQLDDIFTVIIQFSSDVNWNDKIMQNLNRFCRSQKRMDFHFIIKCDE